MMNTVSSNRIKTAGETLSARSSLLAAHYKWVACDGLLYVPQ